MQISKKNNEATLISKAKKEKAKKEATKLSVDQLVEILIDKGILTEEDFK